MCQWVEEVRERLRRFSSESLPLFFLVMWVVVIGVVGSAVIVKILDIFFPTCEHKWVCFVEFVSEQIDAGSVLNTLTSLTWLPLQAHFSPKPCHSNAGGGEAHPAGEHRNRSRGRREEALNEGLTWPAPLFSVCSYLFLVSVLSCQHGLVLLLAYPDLWTASFPFNSPSKHIGRGPDGGLKQTD